MNILNLPSDTLLLLMIKSWPQEIISLTCTCKIFSQLYSLNFATICEVGCRNIFTTIPQWLIKEPMNHQLLFKECYKGKLIDIFSHGNIIGKIKIYPYHSKRSVLDQIQKMSDKKIHTICFLGSPINLTEDFFYTIVDVVGQGKVDDCYFDYEPTNVPLDYYNRIVKIELS